MLKDFTVFPPPKLTFALIKFQISTSFTLPNFIFHDVTTVAFIKIIETTAEYWKARFPPELLKVDVRECSFEEIAKKYEPMIKNQIKKLHMYGRYDEFYQIALIALWEAKMRFDPMKGNFTSYAQKYVTGHLKMYLRSEMNYLTRYLIGLEPGLTEAIAIEDIQDQLDLPIGKIKAILSKKEYVWFHEFYYNQKEITEIATQYDVSANTVKTWRKRALEKIRTNFNTSELLDYLGDIN